MNLPMTQVDDEEIAKCSGIASDEPAGEVSASLAKPRARAATTRSVSAAGGIRSRSAVARWVATRAGERCAVGVVIFSFAEADCAVALAA
jgi:hypothetical protein